MSHFLFGVVNGLRTSSRASINDVIEVSWGSSLQQKLVLEMLGREGKPISTETALSLARSGEDNADGLVSPFQVGQRDVIETLCFALTWLDREREGGSAELWVSEGCDDAFRVIADSCQNLQESVRQILEQSADVPSLRLRLI